MNKHPGQRINIRAVRSAAGSRRPRGRPDGTQRLGLPADAPPLRRQRPQRPRPPHLRPHHDRHL